MKPDDLRKAVKIKIIEIGIDRRGIQTELARALDIHPNSLNMALTGFRSGPRYVQILTDLLAMLSSFQSPITEAHIAGAEEAAFS